MLRNQNKVLIILIAAICFVAFSFKERKNNTAYITGYHEQLNRFRESQLKLLQIIEKSNLQQQQDIDQIKAQLQIARNHLKGVDFWFRYLEPTVYKLINGPLPVEWETEVFEKFEKPYKRNGSG
jgi:cytochrome c peroxidase